MISFDDFLAVSRLDARYWAIADLRSSDAAELLFVPTGKLQIGSLVLDGRDAIRQFLSEREKKHVETNRLTRHFASGFLLGEKAPGCLQASSVLAVFAGAGSIPLASGVPSTIADVEDVFVRDDSGQWLFASRIMRPVFVGAAAASFVR
ncbi:MAG: nuclear transport factor 2 family protein [Comamonas sp.]